MSKNKKKSTNLATKILVWVMFFSMIGSIIASFAIYLIN